MTKDEEIERDTRHKKSIQYVMATKDGRNYMFDLFQATGFLKQSYDPDNPNKMYYREGKKAIGLSTLVLVEKHAPEQYHKMMKENQVKQKEDPDKNTN